MHPTPSRSPNCLFARLDHYLQLSAGCFEPQIRAAYRLTGPYGPAFDCSGALQCPVTVEMVLYEGTAASTKATCAVPTACIVFLSDPCLHAFAAAAFILGRNAVTQTQCNATSELTTCRACYCTSSRHDYAPPRYMMLSRDTLSVSSTKPT